MMILDPQWEGQLPRSMSVQAGDIDWVYNAIFWFSVFFQVAITGALLYFAWKYHRKKGDKLHPPSDFSKLEIFWTVTPVLFIVVLFHIGFKGYVTSAVASPEAMEIRVRAKQWAWEFTYPGGIVEGGVLRVPVNREVKMVMSSDDVIHSFYIPEFRVKKDVVPGMYSTIVFQATKTGEANLFCTEYCGTGHSAMITKVEVVTQEAFDTFLKEGPKKPDGWTDEKWGEDLFVKNGCPTCHARDEAAKQCPTLKGIFGRQEALMSGESVTIDENYILESLRKPQAKIVKGYSNVVMPVFNFSDRQANAVVAYLKSLK